MVVGMVVSAPGSLDVAQLLAREGITGDLRAAFIAYLISHDRPIAEEVVAPRRKDIAAAFVADFDGMTTERVTTVELSAAREALIAEIVGRITAAHRAFLLGFKEGTP